MLHVFSSNLLKSRGLFLVIPFCQITFRFLVATVPNKTPTKREQHWDQPDAEKRHVQQPTLGQSYISLGSVPRILLLLKDEKSTRK